MRLNRHLLNLIVLITMSFTVTGYAQSKDYPSQSIYLLSGHAAGSGGDIVARYIGRKLSEELKQSVIVENKPGAFTMMAIQHVAKSKPDGYTLHINSGNGFAMNPALFDNAPYDPNSSLRPIATLMKLPFVFAVSASSPIQSAEDLKNHLHQKGKDASYGYSSNMAQVAASLFNKMIETDPVGVAYKGAPESLNEMNSGLLDYIVADAVFLMEQAKQGKVRIIAVTTAERSGLAPDVPSLHETGLTGYDLGAWWGIWAPADTPDDIIEKLQKISIKIINETEIRNFMAGMFAEPFEMTSAEMKEYLAEEVIKWADLISLAGIEKQQ